MINTSGKHLFYFDYLFSIRLQFAILNQICKAVIFLQIKAQTGVAQGFSLSQHLSDPGRSADPLVV